MGPAVILAVAVLLGVFVSRSGWAAGAAGVALVLGSVVWLLFSLLLWGMQCDESCDSADPRDWSEVSGAWQWTGQLVLAVAGTALAVGALVCLAWARRVAARRAMAGAAGAWAVWVLVFFARF
jgi:hypothetical protein